MCAAICAAPLVLRASAPAVGVDFPRSLTSYGDVPGEGLWTELSHRVAVQPFNLVATLLFVCAIVHTFLAPKIRHLAHAVETAHSARLARRRAEPGFSGHPEEVSFAGRLLHFLGEVEIVFGVWAVVLVASLTWARGWDTALGYVSGRVSYVEPVFVVIIMALASTRPVMVFAEACLRRLAMLGGGGLAAWWASILIAAPLLGSFITEPAAMTIAAMLLARIFYSAGPSPRFAYATLGLLFVNVSVGGTLTHFAAPPVLMVAGPWKWGTLHLLTHLGWKSAAAIVVSTACVGLVFRREFARMEASPSGRDPDDDGIPEHPIPAWITAVQLAFLGWTVFAAHQPVLAIAGFLFYLGFAQATAQHQRPLELGPPLLVGFFLAGLVVHGGLQGWWIQPVLTRLGERPLFFGALGLTAFNDNAAITYLATLVPGFTETLRYAVLAGAVAGGGLTVIANAPNPAGQAILGRFFPDGVKPLGLLLGALGPTAVVAACYLLL
ncbi:hypothetical protein GALL_40110 [mine drainage metagenome]|uniref:Na+/H+ antiporter n=1 Tax=mine drainage metagenome TaxID=410659 RepID=A0A1J5T282_9ZZZZ